MLVRIEPEEETGLLVYLGAEFHPPAMPEPAPHRSLPTSSRRKTSRSR